MNKNKKPEIKSREVKDGRIIIVYRDGTVESVDKEKYLNSLSEKERMKVTKELILDDLKD